MKPHTSLLTSAP